MVGQDPEPASQKTPHPCILTQSEQCKLECFFTFHHVLMKISAKKIVVFCDKCYIFWLENLNNPGRQPWQRQNQTYPKNKTNFCACIFIADDISASTPKNILIERAKSYTYIAADYKCFLYLSFIWQQNSLDIFRLYDYKNYFIIQTFYTWFYRVALL